MAKKEFKFMLASLEDYSDNAFRTLCHNHGANLTFTEMARVEGLARNNKATWAKLEIKDSTPVQIQLLAGREDQLEKFLGKFKPFEGFKGFNLNLSCPSPNVIKQGRGCAMVKRISKTARLISIIQKFGYPVSIKIRLGTNEFEKKHKVYLNLIKSVEPEFFVIHVRTGEQTNENEPDYSILPECVETGNTIIANGNIDSVEKIELMRKIGVGGVMIGRAAIKNPSIFDTLKGKNVPPMSEIKKEYLAIAEKFNAPQKYRDNVLQSLNF